MFYSYVQKEYKQKGFPMKLAVTPMLRVFAIFVVLSDNIGSLQHGDVFVK